MRPMRLEWRLTASSNAKYLDHDAHLADTMTAITRKDLQTLERIFARSWRRIRGSRPLLKWVGLLTV